MYVWRYPFHYFDWYGVTMCGILSREISLSFAFLFLFWLKKWRKTAACLVMYCMCLNITNHPQVEIVQHNRIVWYWWEKGEETEIGRKPVSLFSLSFLPFGHPDRIETKHGWWLRIAGVGKKWIELILPLSICLSIWPSPSPSEALLSPSFLFLPITIIISSSLMYHCSLSLSSYRSKCKRSSQVRNSSTQMPKHNRQFTRVFYRLFYWRKILLSHRCLEWLEVIFTFPFSVSDFFSSFVITSYNHHSRHSPTHSLPWWCLQSPLHLEHTVVTYDSFPHWHVEDMRRRGHRN